MNYLAHILLSGDSPDAITGGLLGDFVKGRVDQRFGPEVCDAIQLHRAIDRYTDAHAIPRATRALISPDRRRFAGILVDVFYDHFLARHWPKFSDVPLADYTGRVYAILLHRRATLPERLQWILPWMSQDDWLGSYGELWGVDAALNGIARRLRRFRQLDGGEALSETSLSQGPRLHRAVEGRAPGMVRLRISRAALLAGGVYELEAHYREMEEHFLAFFPELMHYAAERRASVTAARTAPVPFPALAATS